MQTLVDRAIDAVRYPTEDPQTTLVLVLAVAVVGMLVAVVFIALASSAEKRSVMSDDAILEKESTPDAE